MADLPHATVVLRDGTRASGAVAASTPAEITLNLDAGGSREMVADKCWRSRNCAGDCDGGKDAGDRAPGVIWGHDRVDIP